MIRGLPPNVSNGARSQAFFERCRVVVFFGGRYPNRMVRDCLLGYNFVFYGRRLTLWGHFCFFWLALLFAQRLLTLSTRNYVICYLTGSGLARWLIHERVTKSGFRH